MEDVGRHDVPGNASDDLGEHVDGHVKRLIVADFLQHVRQPEVGRAEGHEAEDGGGNELGSVLQGCLHCFLSGSGRGGGRLTSVKDRSFHTCSGIRGSGQYASQKTKATSRRAPIISMDKTVADVQPTDGPSLNEWRGQQRAKGQ